MSYSRRLVISILLISFLIIFSGCNPTDYQKSIFGDNWAIARESDSYYFYRCVRNSLDNYTQNIRFSTFYGMQTLMILDSDGENSVKVNFESKIDSGKFKAVLVTPDEEVIDIFDQSKKGSVTLKLPSGKSRIKIVGYKAKGKLKLSVKSNGDVNIDKPSD